MPESSSRLSGEELRVAYDIEDLKSDNFDVQNEFQGQTECGSDELLQPIVFYLDTQSFHICSQMVKYLL